MKTIKVIDLLNMIVNGEEVPEKIRYKGDCWYLKQKYTNRLPYYSNGYNKDNFFTVEEDEYFSHSLNDEVEIIEEDKKIEKLDTSKYFYVGPYTENQPKRYDIDVFNKINEIINYINKEGGNDDMFS